MRNSRGMPVGWVLAPLSEVAEINPARQQADLPADTPFHFVPMNAVVEEFGGINVNTMRPLSEVAKGYTQFCEGDVIFAKITPCMENGKLAIVPKLSSPWAYGSTEFHVLRVRHGLQQKWLAYFLSQILVRRDARNHMAGSAGQLRVPLTWLEQVLVPLPPESEQRRIVAKIEELLSDLDAGVSSFQRVTASLKRYRAAVLNSAITGKLTEAWRTQNPPTVPAKTLLVDILKDRRGKWETEQVDRHAAAGRTPPKDWKSRYVEPRPAPVAESKLLPQGWTKATFEQVTEEVTVGFVGPMKDRYVDHGISFLRSQNVRPLRFDPLGLQHIPADFDDDLKKSRLFGGELLVVRSGVNVGDACVFPETAAPANCADLVISRPSTMFTAKYGAIFIMSPEGQAALHLRRTGNAQPHFNIGAMKQTPFPLPPLDEQRQIVAEVERRLSVADAVEAEVEHGLKRAARLRQAILKRAFEGRLVPQDPADNPFVVRHEKAEAERVAMSPSLSRRSGLKAPRQDSMRREGLFDAR
jgi:type I restriction enzyme S subunit